MKKEYLGDSVYADFDGYHIVLTTENGDGPSNTIMLEDSVVERLLNYVSKHFTHINNYKEGYCDALHDYGIWNNGIQHIGCLETPIKDVINSKFGK